MTLETTAVTLDEVKVARIPEDNLNFFVGGEPFWSIIFDLTTSSLKPIKSTSGK